MKRIIPILLLACCMVSCLDTQSDYTPVIYLSYVTTTGGDTLKVRYDSISNTYKIDSVELTDTVYFAVGFDAIGNNLKSTSLSWDTTMVGMKANYSAEFISVLDSASDTTMIQLYYPDGYTYAALPIYMTPKKAGSAQVGLHITTDSKYSPTDEYLIFQILTPTDTTSAD